MKEPCGKPGDECACARTSKERGNLCDLLWSLPYPQLIVSCSLQKGHFLLLPQLGQTCVQPGVGPHMYSVHLYSAFPSAGLRTIRVPLFNSLSPCVDKTGKDLQCSKSYTFKHQKTRVQLYSGVKTALDRTPRGLSQAFGGQLTPLQSHYTGRGGKPHLPHFFPYAPARTKTHSALVCTKVKSVQKQFGIKDDNFGGRTLLPENIYIIYKIHLMLWSTQGA